MNKVNELIKEYKKLKDNEIVINNNMYQKRVAFEKEITEDGKQLKSIRKKQDELNKFVLDNKLLSVKLGDLLQEISKLTKINVQDIKCEVEGPVYPSFRKLKMKRVLELINEDENANLTFHIKSVDKESEDYDELFHICFDNKLNVFEKLSDGQELAKYFYLDYSDESETGDFFITLCIDEKVHQNLVCNFNFDRVVGNKRNYSYEILKNAILNCVKRDEEKIK